MNHSINLERTTGHIFPALQVLSFGLALLILTVALPYRADAAAEKQVACRPGKQSFTLGIEFTKIHWNIKDCFCSKDKNALKKAVAQADKLSSLVSVTKMYVSEIKKEQDSITEEFYCYSAKTIRDWQSGKPQSVVKPQSAGTSSVQ